VRIAVDMVEERIISKKEALLRVEADHLNQLLRPIFDNKDKEQAAKEGRILAKGLPAGPGRPPVRLFSTQRMPWHGKKTANRSCCAELRPAPTISVAWRQHREFLPLEAG
jgi:pyruvate,orthophosphate dikinase